MTFTHIMESQIIDYRHDKYLKKDEVLRGYKDAEENGGRKYNWGELIIEDEKVKGEGDSSVSGERSESAIGTPTSNNN